MSILWQNTRVLVTGSSGFVGRNLTPMLKDKGCDLRTPTRRDYDLMEQEQVREMFRDIRPTVVFHLAGLVGGILANRERTAEFNYHNLLMGAMVLHEAWRSGVQKYITLIGGCSYPAQARSPISETQLWNGYPQSESAPYSLAKAMSVVQAQAYRAQYGFNAVVLVPGNLYGPYDNFHLETSHVIPALIRKSYEAKRQGLSEITVWGTGRAIRDFIYVEDCCEAIVLAAETYDAGEIVNISSGVETTIRELVTMINELVGYTGDVRWDSSKPEGQACKTFEVTRMRERLQYTPRTCLREGLERTIKWFQANYSSAVARRAG